MNPIELSIFSSRINAVCDEMGAVLQRAAFSPNIRDRLDFSCAVFDVQGELSAQAAHIPVHLGSMAYAMRDIVKEIDWQNGDMVVVNDPFLGGTHLPDVTLIAPVFVAGELMGFVANRAHHADIGGDSPGSMPISKSLAEEGLVIPPQHLLQNGEINQPVMQAILQVTRNKTIGKGDFSAQISANRSGVLRLVDLIEKLGRSTYQIALDKLNNYAFSIAREVLASIPNGDYHFTDVMDDDGLGNIDLAIKLNLTVRDSTVHADFAGTAPQTAGNINCPLSVVAAAVYYVFRCLMPDYTPACAGSFKPITIEAPPGSLVNAKRPAAVAAGNVETSTRIVDVVMGALTEAIPDQIPAASHGSMNNLAMGSLDGGSSDGSSSEGSSSEGSSSEGSSSEGETSDGAGIHKDRHWDYYETIGGGMGAGPTYQGLSAVQTHMTNTRNTPIEVLEANYPLQVNRYAIREGTGGTGLHRGGDGLIREIEFTETTSVTLLTERRTHAPWGSANGGSGQSGVNKINNKIMPAKFSTTVEKGDCLIIETAGGGGWGKVN